MFPLGRPVLPGEVLGLRVFEGRYVTLMERIMHRPNPEFGVVMIDRGSEVGGGDVRRSVGTAVVAARIQTLDEGHFAVASIGRRRLRVVEWLHDDPHPWAMVSDWPEERVDHTGDLSTLIQQLNERCTALLIAAGSEPVPVVDVHRPWPELVYGMAHRLPVGPADLQLLLEAIDRRSAFRIMEEIVQHLEDLRRFDSLDRE